MRFSETSTLPAPPAAVFALLTDPAVLRERAARTGAVEHTGEVSAEGPRTVVRSRRTVSTRGLPGPAARFLGATAVVEQEERWEAAAADGSRRGEHRLTVAGAPLELLAQVLLRPEGAGSAHEVEGELTVRVPLLGRSVEQAALPGLLDLLRAEVAVVRDRLTAPDAG